MKSKLSNIKIAYILSFISELYFPIAIWIFYYARFFDFKQIALITAIKGLTGILFEIPTGAFADTYGRKMSIFLSFFLAVFSMFSIAYASTFWIFIAIGVLNSLANALYSGSVEALVYDTLKQNNQQKQYDHIISKIESISWVGLFIGSISGGFLYQFSFRLPYLFQSFLYLIGTILSLKLIEPEIVSHHKNAKQIINQNINGFKELFANPQITRISLFFITIAAGYHIASSILGISQAQEYGMSPSAVGFLFGAGFIISALASYFYPSLKKRFGSKPLLILASCTLISSFIFAKFFGIIIGSILILLRISSSTTFNNTRSIIINRFLTSKNRATSISTLVLLSHLPYTILAYGIGDYIDNTSPNSFAFTLGISIIIIITLQQTYFTFFKKPTS